ncbi:MAG: TonB-dependent receptor [Tannerella sp.]|jgi:TonB-linked SusC/RagA family outer membrane protein|nr:TonB-dependent receptor [Tannerella sp.]
MKCLKKKVHLFLWLFLLPILSYAQTAITGTVIDVNGETVIGANVIEKGTRNSIVTDVNGKFSLTVADNAVLQVSYLGYVTQEIKLGKRTKIDVVLKEDLQQLDEVVVVGFGTQKKANLTGAVGAVSSKALDSRPVQNAVQALQGLSPGLNITQASGQLNAKPSINVRGVTTVGAGSYGDPLILIDGMEGDLYNINPQDIETISVLKDAAASSIYGSRAPFGVVLITTKKGKQGKAVINYNNSFRYATPVIIPKIADSYSFALYYNDGRINNQEQPYFTAERIQRILDYQRGIVKEAMPISSTDPTYWADGYNYGNDNVDYYKVLFNQWSPSNEHNVSVSGGTEMLNYYVSGNYLGKEGFLAFGGDDYNRYTLTGKVNGKINKWLDINYTSRLIREGYEQPYYLNSGFYADLARTGWPVLPLYDANGYLSSSPTPPLNLRDGGRRSTNTQQLYQQVQVVISPLAGWKIFGDANFRFTNTYEHAHQLRTFKHNVLGELMNQNQDTRVEESSNRGNYSNFNLWSEYETTFGDHSLKATAGFQAESNRNDLFSAVREGIILSSHTTLNNTTGTSATGATVAPTVSGSAYDWAVAGFFGRLNYNYKERYLLEVNLRYDGSSRFLRGERWNVLPSVSAGWNIANEDFWKPLASLVNVLKFRISYGTLGNQNTSGYYPMYVEMPLGTANGVWLQNGAKPNTATVPGMISSSLTWERITSQNIGVDIGAFNNRLTSSFDLFRRRTSEMVGPAPQLPATLGTAVPRTNNTELESSGFEWEIQWNDHIKTIGLSYSVRFVLSDSQAEILSYPNETGSFSTYRTGQKVGELWGYETIGIAKTQEEMDNHLASMTNGGQSTIAGNWSAGDIMYADLNGDGKIDGGASTIDDHGDLTLIGNTQARFPFGLDISADWKGFDFRIFFQGVMKRDYNPYSYYFWGITSSFWSSTMLVEHIDYFRDDPNHPLGLNLDAYFPRPMFGTDKNHLTQSRYVQDASYIRLKNLQVGYTLPPLSLTRKFGIQRLRVFVSGENLWTATRLFKMFDPETIDGGWNGNSYPLSKTLSLGLSISF